MSLYSFSYCNPFPDLYTWGFLSQCLGSNVGASLVPNTRWFGNETICAHAYTDRKWRPTATDSRLVCLWIASIWSQSELSTHWVFVDLHALMNICFVHKWRWELKRFVSHHCWTKSWWELGKWHFCYSALLCLTLFHDAFGKPCEFCRL